MAETTRTANLAHPRRPDPRLRPGCNDLATLRPDLAAQWDPDRNGELAPQDVTAGSGRKAWWRCDRGHAWEAAVRNRASGSGCTVCTGKQVLAGINDLATVRPDLAAQWHPDRNGELAPQDVTVGSNRKVWWRCDRGHAWKATVARRAGGRGCPVCAGKQVLAGFNDLATVRPDLAAPVAPGPQRGARPGGRDDRLGPGGAVALRQRAHVVGEGRLQVSWPRLPGLLRAEGSRRRQRPGDRPPGPRRTVAPGPQRGARADGRDGRVSPENVVALR